MAISHWRIYHAEYDKDNNLINRPSIKQLQGNVIQVKQRMKSLYGYLLTNNSKILFRYEEFFNKADYVMDRIEIYFGIKIGVETRKMITDKTSLDSNQSIADEMLERAEGRAFDSWDDETHIHGRHIASPTPGSYKDILTESQIDYLDKELEFELNLLGYLKNEKSLHK